jgi:hypothetical protein
MEVGLHPHQNRSVLREDRGRKTEVEQMKLCPKTGDGRKTRTSNQSRFLETDPETESHPEVEMRLNR